MTMGTVHIKKKTNKRNNRYLFDGRCAFQLNDPKKLQRNDHPKRSQDRVTTTAATYRLPRDRSPPL